MKLVVKYFLADVIFGFVLDLDKLVFPWQMYFSGGCLRLAFSFIQVNVVSPYMQNASVA
jgi:hypothetical protein